MDDEAKLAHKREFARLRAKKYYDAKQELINERRRNNYNTINGNKKDNEKVCHFSEMQFLKREDIFIYFCFYNFCQTLFLFIFILFVETLWT